MKKNLLSFSNLSVLILLCGISLFGQQKKFDIPFVKELKLLAPKSAGSGYNELLKVNSFQKIDKSILKTAADEFWSSDFGLPGVDQFLGMYYITSMAVKDNDLYVGGWFGYAQDSLVNYIAKWDGIKFSSLCGGTNGPVWTIKISGNDVYVGGQFTKAGNISARNIARWDGSAWHSLGSGVNGTVFTIEAAGSIVYAGGAFDSAGNSQANYIARWSGTSWNPLGSGTDNPVFTLKIAGSDLYLGGEFTTAGTIPAYYIAKWDGLNYDSLSSGTNSSVNIIEADGDIIYAGGYFTVAGGVTVNRIAKWQSNAWAKVGSGVDNEVKDILIDSGNVYICGTFGNVGVLPANGVAKWNGTSWSTLGEGIYCDFIYSPGIVLALEMIEENLYAGGAFDNAGDISTNNLAVWNGTEWNGVGCPEPLIGGSNYAIYTAVVYNDELYVGGQFNRIGNIKAKGIAKWNGSSWTEIGSGVSSSSFAGYMVNSISFNGNDMYVGGNFNKAGDVNVRNIAKWNGSQWSALGNGVNRTVRDIEVVSGNVYVGGDFDSAGTISAAKVARWKGSDWNALGAGFNLGVTDLQLAGSDLYATGGFLTSGSDTVNYIAKWDGASWSKVGKGFNNYGWDLCFYNNLLYAGGVFTEAGGNPASCVAVWDGNEWKSVGSGLNNSLGGGVVSDLEIFEGKLYAGGHFDQAGMLTVNNVAVYDSDSWKPLGRGLEGAPPICYDISIDDKGPSGYDIYFGGIFSLAGGKPSYNLARYTVSLVGVENESILAPENFYLAQNYPNPFNPATHFGFRIANFGLVTLKVFDVLGNEVSTLVNEEKPAGEYEVEFNARNLSSGVYFYQLKAGSFVQTKKMILLR